MTETAKSPTKNKVCLIVHDGWGLSDDAFGNAIKAAETPHMSKLSENEDRFMKLAAHGIAVGLSDGLMGNSEVGHLNIGAGRIVWQDIVKINQAIEDGQLKDETAAKHGGKVVAGAVQNALAGNKRLHFLGLVSDGGVHSHISHLKALLEATNHYDKSGDLEVYIHFIGDGRDTDPKSAALYLGQLLESIKDNTKVKVATIVGRYYAMDRDKRWERVKLAVDALHQGQYIDKGDGKGNQKSEDVTIITGGGEAAVAEIERNYNLEKPVTDEFLKPIIVGYDGDEEGKKSRIQDGDTLFFFNYRSDRMREITSVFGIDPKPELKEGAWKLPTGLHISTMSQYNAEFPFAVAFPPQSMKNVLAQVIADNKLTQCHIAETEKYAHVTFFFNGGVETRFANEERELIPSPNDVATYDKRPGMSVAKVAEKVADTVKSNKYDFVMCNFAPPDMVGHTGNEEAAIKAITETDVAVGTVHDACKEAGYVLFITADHGNAEQMKNRDQDEPDKLEKAKPHTAHTTNPVPFIMALPNGFPESELKFAPYTGDAKAKDAPKLADVAPTILAVMGIKAPEQMDGRSLLATDLSIQSRI